MRALENTSTNSRFLHGRKLGLVRTWDVSSSETPPTDDVRVFRVLPIINSTRRCTAEKR